MAHEDTRKQPKNPTQNELCKHTVELANICDK